MTFHYCTGIKHSLNVQNARAQLINHGNFTPQYVWIKDNLKSDPLGSLTYTLLFISIFISVLTWISKRSIKIKKFMKNMCQYKKANTIGHPADIHFDTEYSFDEQSTNFDLEAGQIIAMIILAAICIYPMLMVVKLANENENNLNSGVGKIMVYVSQISLVIFIYNIFPAQIIFNNPRMLKTILREFKDSTLGRKIWTDPIMEHS